MYSRAIISITNKCNLSCIHCYNSKRQKEKDDPNWFNEGLVKKFKELGIYHVGLTGGEPLIKWDELLKYLSMLNKYGFYKVLTTNGTLLNDEKLEILKKYEVDVIQISVDGALKNTHEYVRGKGTYDKIYRFFTEEKYKKYNILPMFTINRKNYEELENYINQMIENGLEQVNFERYIPCSERGSEELKLTKESLKKAYSLLYEYENKINIHVNDPLYTAYKLSRKNISQNVIESMKTWELGCSAGQTSIYIDVNGDVYPCTFSNNSLFNLCKDGINLLDKNWKCNTAAKGTKCNMCDYSCVCGGCRATALYTEGGSWEGEDPLCFVN